MKMITISNSDFKYFIKENKYYVDKTLLIEELFDKGDQVTLLPRPRRFGKTLNLSMLKYYFDINEDNRYLFKGLNIEKSNIFEKHLNKYPTIFLTFKDVKGSDWEKDYDRIKELISDLYEEHSYLLESDKLNDREKIYINQVLNKEDLDYSISLMKLSKYLCKYYDERVVILIDEYDTPLNKELDNEHYKSIINFLRDMISTTFKGNDYLFRGVITGILRVAKESIFSRANNILVRTILDKDFSDKFGFTEEEVIKTLDYYDIKNKIEEVREWYNGYTFGNNIIYNPFSIANYVKSKSLKAYWVRSGESTLVKNLLINSDISVKENLEKLIKGESIEESIEENIVFNQLSNKKYLWSLLLFSGYLKAIKKDEDPESDKYIISVPNKEVMRVYKSLIEDYFNILTNNAFKIIDYIKDGNIELFENELKRIIMNIVSNHDIKYENSLHMLIISFFYYLEASDEYRVKSNIESGNGRYDICIIPKNKNKLGYVIELKRADKNEKVEECAERALNQIEEKKYYTELISNNIKNILLLGLGFAGKNIVIKTKKL